ncbi:MAG: YjbH domain-containing protein [Bacteroidales bacterium]|nr:YjbH domain-containing protein [Bacteroidales bacterium]MCF8455631.1 YjbH domain-containing protein [Bacteroidales bacterium]
MIKIYKLAFFVILFIHLSATAFEVCAQESYPSLIQTLRNEGYRNIKVMSDEGNLIVAFENNVYRFEIEAIAKALSIVGNHCGTHTNIILLIQKLQVPIAEITVPVTQLKALQEKAISSEEFKNSLQIAYSGSKYWNKIRSFDSSNKSTFDLDFVVEPKIGFQLGNYDYPFRYQIRLLPAFETSLWKGQKFKAQMSVPIYSHHVDTNKFVSPHIISFEQNIRLAKGLYSKLTAGWFTEKRYGLDAEIVKYFFDGRLNIRGNIGYTGYMLFTGRRSFELYDTAYVTADTTIVYNYKKYSRPTIEYGSLDYFQYFLNLEYRLSKYDMAINVGYGKYLFENKAYTIDIYRNFNEYILGFQAHFSETGNNYGFHISIPLWPEPYFKNKKIRIRPSKYINYSYLATRDYVNTYEAGNSIDEGIRELNPQMIKNYLTKSLLLYLYKER